MSDSAEKRVWDSAPPCEVLPSCHVPPSAIKVSGRESATKPWGPDPQCFRLFELLGTEPQQPALEPNREMEAADLELDIHSGQNNVFCKTSLPTCFFFQNGITSQVVFIQLSLCHWPNALCLPCSKVSCR